MIYAYFKPLFLICNIFGLTTPLMTPQGKPKKNNSWTKLWSLLVCLAMLCAYFLPASSNGLLNSDLKQNLDVIADINAVVVNAAIMLINIFNSDQIYRNLCHIIDIIGITFDLDEETIYLFAIKMYSWFGIPIFMFVTLMITEIFLSLPPYTLLMRIPTFLMIVSLVMHLYLILAFLKLINTKLSSMLTCDTIKKVKTSKYNNVYYVLNPEIQFINANDNKYLDMKQLCKLYDDLATCIHLLEKCHGLQVLLYIWSMFLNALIGVTVMATNQTNTKWLVISKGLLPLFWYFLGTLVDDQIQKEVDKTATILIKCLIDYKCDASRKSTLQIFKELVGNDRLQFIASNLFHFNYSLLLNTILNVITYSIILIQVIVS